MEKLWQIKVHFLHREYLEIVKIGSEMLWFFIVNVYYCTVNCRLITAHSNTELISPGKRTTVVGETTILI